MSAGLDQRLKDAMAARANADASWLSGLREAARNAFGREGLPTRRLEAWKYSDLARALSEPSVGSAAVRPPLALPGVPLARFVDGVFDETGSTVQSLGALALRQVLAQDITPFETLLGQVNRQEDHALVNLNTALMEDGLVLHIPRGKTLEVPIHLRFDWTDEAKEDDRHLRVLIVLEEGAQATLLETHTGTPGFSSIVTELKLGPDAKLTHMRLERLSAGARQSAVTLSDLAKAASYAGFYFSEGGQFARHEALLRLAGEGASATLEGVYLVAEARHCDNTTVITHAVPDTTSQQTFRGVLSGHARGVYQGCVQVRPDAQRTDARQLSRALLLSRQAEVATKPELEILADDVKCSHGATTGELDGAALFFLRARGIPEPEARALLVEAFLSAPLETIAHDGLRGLAQTAVTDWLKAHAGEVSHVS